MSAPPSVAAAEAVRTVPPPRARARPGMVRRVRGKLVQGIRVAQFGCARIAARSGFLASCYFAFCSRRFDDEHRAVLSGRVRNRDASTQLDGSNARLRRNVHRLEKGLVMRPRRDVFGTGFIVDTVALFVDMASSGLADEEEMRWCRDVLERYFDAVVDEPSIVQARRMFEAAPALTDGAPESAPRAPYASAARPVSGVAFDDLRTLYQRRRSVRWFEDRPVDDRLLDRAIEAAALAPTACNRIPYRFYVANDRAVAARLAGFAMGTTGFAENIPCLIAVVGDLSCYPEERDRHLVYIDGSLALMQLELAIETLGLSSCTINWPDVGAIDRRFRDAVALLPCERIVCLLAVGHADPEGGVPYSSKKGTRQLRVDVRLREAERVEC